MRLPSLRFSRLLTLNVILVLVSGCSSTNVINLEGSDTTRFSDLRLSFPVTKEDENKRIKLRLTDASGEFSQDIPEGKVVDFEDFQLLGPDQVSSVADITVASISYGRVGEALRKNFFLSAFAGISRTNFEIDMETESGQITGVRNKSFEVYIDLGIYHLLLPYLTGGLEAAFSRNLSLSGITEWGVVLKFRPSKHMEIMGGYRWFKYDYFTTDYDSGIIVELNGPFIGLNLPF
ncbi:MAG: hypothetical protein KJP10_01255 [Gammaproteobacteria bacterium]|nr:hypothetical protein [Gammaproteobacteria bacterium]